MPFGDLFRTLRRQRTKYIPCSSDDSELEDNCPSLEATGAKTTTLSEHSAKTVSDASPKTLAPQTTNSQAYEMLPAVDDDYTPTSFRDIEQPVIRAGMVWADSETKVLKEILLREGDVNESFGSIRRGEDAIKRKWRKMLAELPEEKRQRMQAKAADRRKPDQSLSGDMTAQRPGALPANRLSVLPEEEDCSVGDFETTGNRDYPMTTGLSSDIHKEIERTIPLVRLSEAADDPSRSQRSFDVPSLSAACDDCRRKHKRCNHRTEVDSDDCPVEHRKRGRKPKKRPLSIHANRSGVRTVNTSGTSRFQVHRSRSGPRSTTEQEQSAFDATSTGPSVTIENQSGNSHEEGPHLPIDAPDMSFSKVRRGYIPRPPNLTKNGKRRGRPPKYLAQQKQRVVQQVVPRVPLACLSDSESNYQTYRPRKRRAIDDYEFSERFDKVIMGRFNETETSSVSESVCEEDRSWCRMECKVEIEEEEWSSTSTQSGRKLRANDIDMDIHPKISIASLLNPTCVKPISIHADSLAESTSCVPVSQDMRDTAVVRDSNDEPPKRWLRVRQSSGVLPANNLKRPHLSRAATSIKDAHRTQRYQSADWSSVYGQENVHPSFKNKKPTAPDCNGQILTPVTDYLRQSLSHRPSPPPIEPYFSVATIPNFQYSSVRTTAMKRL